MEIEIDLNKTLEENARDYFEKSKLAKRKIVGLQKAILAQKEKQPQITQAEKESALLEKKEKRKAKWYEKFRWFISSDGLLVVGGRDAHQNEELVKKQMRNEDTYFHADIFGAPHCVIKASERNSLVPGTTMNEAAEFAITFSKAFEQGFASEDAYSVKPEQVSKRAPSGTSMGTGAFMIYGERNYFRKARVNAAIGFHQKEKVLMCGPTNAVKKWCKPFFELKQGRTEKNVFAKKLKDKFAEKGIEASIDEILSLMPNGTFTSD